MSEPRQVAETDLMPLGECGSCGESPEGECPESKRPCGHHCNHVWTHDACDWCGVEFGVDQCAHQWLDRPESDTHECLICGEERHG